MTILILNAGSATLKFRVYNGAHEVISGNVERIGLQDSFITLQGKGIAPQRLDAQKIPSHIEALRLVSLVLHEALKKVDLEIEAVGHRVVHGGEEFTLPTKVTSSILTRLRKYARLAPLHNPIELAVLAEARKLYTQIPHVAVFDTEFFRDIPEHIYLYALPPAYHKQFGIRRFGFHGLSHEYVTRMAAQKLKKPLRSSSFISCHLGSGSSITVVDRGKVVDTTMGFTPLEGLTMGTRVGDLDASIPLFLQRQAHMTEKQIFDLLYSKSGLLGVSGFSSDMRDILKAAHSTSSSTQARARKKRARLARDMFVYDVQRYVGSYASLLKDCDGLIFTGGIGERSSEIRRLILRGLRGMQKMRTLVIHTNEERIIAEKVHNLLT